MSRPGALRKRSSRLTKLWKSHFTHEKVSRRVYQDQDQGQELNKESLNGEEGGEKTKDIEEALKCKEEPSKLKELEEECLKNKG